MTVIDNYNDGVLYSIFGWDTIDNIYWPRIVPGQNTWVLKATGDVGCKVTVKYNAPYKRVGGYM